MLYLSQFRFPDKEVEYTYIFEEKKLKGRCYDTTDFVCLILIQSPFYMEETDLEKQQRLM